MLNGNAVWPIILLTCSLFNFFYVLHFQRKKTKFEECSVSMYMLCGTVLSIFGTICIIGV